MVGFTWAQTDRDPAIAISSRIGGSWTDWQQVPVLHDRPDAEPGVRQIVGTELTWIGDTDGIQVRVSGQRPADLTLVLLYPQARSGDRIASSTSPFSEVGSAEAAASGSVPPPVILSRSDWGADESWRDGEPRVNPTIQQMHVHHTANSNDYAESDVPALIRGMYRYHTKSLGWSDLAYNFVVDQFGRVWQGRAGDAATAVRGAHTLGFNASSCGVAVIGNYDLVAPSAAAVRGIVELSAWKLDRYDRDPTGVTGVVSEGSDKFPAFRTVTLPVIDGHRDTNDTSCPGQLLYTVLPRIRNRTKRRIARAAAPLAITILQGSVVSGSAVLGQALTVTPGVFQPADSVAAYTWLRDGAAVPGAVGATYSTVPEDVGTELSVRVDVTRPDYEPANELLTVAGPVTAVPTISVRPAGKRGRAVIRVAVDVPGLPGKVKGQVTVRLRMRTMKVRLADGKAVARFRDLGPRDYRVTVDYHGKGPISPAQVVSSVRVRKNRRRG
ncbi:MAG: N-acetylmuramoyl-L-alanine amidase [Nocardioides sp.]